MLAKQAQIVFLALPHGVAAEFAVPLLQLGCQVIDLSADFRVKSAAVYKDFYAHDHPAPELLAQAVYGLPEVYRAQIKKASLVASPGCYPTSILLPTVPLLKAGLVQPTGIIADSLSGVSGAGRKAELDYLFVECNESVRPYGIPKHRHLSEIEQELSVAAGTQVTIQFTPHLIPVNRGILTTLYLQPADPQPSTFDPQPTEPPATRPPMPTSRSCGCWKARPCPTRRTSSAPTSSKSPGAIDPRTGRLIVMSAEDNLVKGASGQAVQSMNLMCGFPETAGLI